MISHNKMSGDYHSFTTSHNQGTGGLNEATNLFEAKLSQQEYDSIFDNPPTFQEKKAFVEIFRRKWREDKGYCSLFEKLAQYKQAKEQDSGRGVSGLKQRPRSQTVQGRRIQVQVMNFREKII